MGSRCYARPLSPVLTLPRKVGVTAFFLYHRPCLFDPQWNVAPE